MIKFKNLTLVEGGADIWNPRRRIPAPGVGVHPIGEWEDVPEERYLDGYVPARRLVVLSAPDGVDGIHEAMGAYEWRLWHGGPASGFEYRTLTPLG